MKKVFKTIGRAVKSFFRRLGNIILLIFACKGELADEAVRQDILSFDGEGRDKFGK